MINRVWIALVLVLVFVGSVSASAPLSSSLHTKQAGRIAYGETLQWDASVNGGTPASVVDFFYPQGMRIATKSAGCFEAAPAWIRCKAARHLTIRLTLPKPTAVTCVPGFPCRQPPTIEGTIVFRTVLSDQTHVYGRTDQQLKVTK